MEINLNNKSISQERLKNSKISFGRKTKAKPIYHYTSIGGLEGILSSKSFRFTNIKYMNDKDEITAGLESVAKAFGATEEERERLLSAFLNHGIQTFICCFSLEEDSLPMWNYYTKEVNGQGYNIEFDDKKLVESILRNNPLLDGCNIAFGNVDYSKDNDSEYSRWFTREILTSMELSISKLFLAVAKGVSSNKAMTIDSDAIEKWEARIADTEQNKKLNDFPVYFYNGNNCGFERDPSGDFLYFVKRDCFKQEKEFRIVITVPDELLPRLAEENIYKFRVSNGVLIPYIELKFSEDVVKSITVSPTVYSDLVELSIQDFLSYCGYKINNFSEFIRHSKVPVRY